MLRLGIEGIGRLVQFAMAAKHVTLSIPARWR
jgi:hypothetical protein